MKRYKVIDEMCCEESYFDDLKKAKSKALNVQGILIDTQTEEILADYTF